MCGHRLRRSLIAMNLGAVESIPLFASVPRRRHWHLARLADEIEVAAGAELTRQGGYAREFFVVVSGTADVHRDGERVGRLEPGDFFGEVGLLAPTGSAAPPSSPRRRCACSCSRDTSSASCCSPLPPSRRASAGPRLSAPRARAPSSNHAGLVGRADELSRLRAGRPVSRAAREIPVARRGQDAEADHRAPPSGARRTSCAASVLADVAEPRWCGVPTGETSAAPSPRPASADPPEWLAAVPPEALASFAGARATCSTWRRSTRRWSRCSRTSWVDRSTGTSSPRCRRSLRDQRLLLVCHIPQRRAAPPPPPAAVPGRDASGASSASSSRGSRRSSWRRMWRGSSGARPSRRPWPRLHARTGGNPFFAEELLAGGAAVLRRRPQRRIARLTVAPGPCCAWRRPRSDRAGAGGPGRGPGRGARHGALRAALDERVLVADADGSAFRHALLREAAFGDLLPGGRARCTSPLRGRLATTRPRARAPAAEIAHHGRRPTVPEALAACVQAGLEAEQMLGLRGGRAALRAGPRDLGPRRGRRGERSDRASARRRRPCGAGAEPRGRAPPRRGPGPRGARLGLV